MVARRFALLGILLLLAGCRSPYHSDQGALLGGLLGAGTGAIVGNAVGSTGAGAAIGAGVGALSGAAVGSGMDEIEARNRAQIEQQLGRQVAAGSVTVADVVSMTQAGVDPELIANHVRHNGPAAPLQTSDLIYLQQQGVSKKVIAAMQEPPRVVQPAAYTAAAPPRTVIVEDPYYYDYPPPYYWGPPRYRYRCYPRYRPGVSWGVTVGN
ncbi:MAG: hypothetical protein JXB10_07220 [Pirellulales bacterium]|nr:hypothetical protein [Pirellulales bacterium]